MTTSTTTATTTTTESMPIEPVIQFENYFIEILFQSDVFILVIPYYVDRSYLESGDGSSQISAIIHAPNNEYADQAAYALVNGKPHIFGGESNGNKVVYF